MLGDKILFKPHHYKQASDVLFKIEENKNKKKIVCLIGGTAGVGKTESAIIVQRELYKCNIHSLIVSLDDYYDTPWKERDKIRIERGIDKVGAREIMWQSLAWIVKEYYDGYELYLKRVNKYSNQIERVYTNSNFKVLIIEGLYAGHLKDKADIFHHIEGTPKDTYEFRKERGKEKCDDEFRKLIIQKEYEEVERLR